MKNRPAGVLLAMTFATLTGCAGTPAAVVSGDGSQAPGWTGRTQVLGNHSSVASGAEATELQQKWGAGRGR